MLAAKILLVCLAAIAASEVNGQSGVGVTTRYWDCCKPSCAWRENINNLLFGPVQTCDVVGNVVDPSVQSGCNGGNAYMCSKQQPRIINLNTAIGFVAARIPGLSLQDMCCTCFRLTFPSVPLLAGKQMIVQVTNTGNDLEPGHFDIQIPGGGVGIFNGCTNQFKTAVDGWGQRYGGITSIAECANLPLLLQPGCRFRFTWLMGVSNPAVVYTRVPCPVALVALSGCKRSDDPIMG